MTLHEQFNGCWVIRSPEELPGDSDVAITWQPWEDPTRLRPEEVKPYVGYFCIKWEGVHTHFHSATGLIPEEESILDGLKYMWAMGGLVTDGTPIPIQEDEGGFWA